ncbi:MAG: MerR family transcriptional regulator [Paludibacteraceae bacterium]|nr:MerR family transcriptional regulator [Paludibacteraceae bacterium]
MQLTKQYYSIGEVAEMMGLATSKLRFWESKFDFLQPKTNSKGTRFYSQEDIKLLQLIAYYADEKGMTLEGIAAQIKKNKHKAQNEYSVTEELAHLRDEIYAIRAEMNKLKE